MIQVGAANIAQLDTLEIIPDALIRIEVGRISGQLLQMQAFGRSPLEKVFDLMSAVNGRAIPNEHNLAGNLAQEHTQEADDRFGDERDALA